ncbi:hypothetical protein [Williamsia sterculiae]|uniref:Thiamine biosynthesis lipoprotein n=1 Tax=Williamsia sterculiae TaxID=1344003 RepID=A0A1N7F131_9NOCA|nr:hypothetical protein [Williamsia sterculiae]SIR93942.1 thiamine biosynthesis lipoprotein [Williamsia sterculiae]
MIATATLSGLDTDITVSVTEPQSLNAAIHLIDGMAHALDRSVNRGRPDAEIRLLDVADGRPVLVGALLHQVIVAALYQADLTDGANRAVRRSAVPDYRHLPAMEFTTGGVRPVTVRTVAQMPIWLRPQAGPTGRVTVPIDVRLELLPTARAFLVDNGARLVAGRLGCGVRVAIGPAGDTVVATAGNPPLGGWHSPIAHRDIELPVGAGLATVRESDLRAAPVGPFDPRPHAAFREVTVLADDPGTAWALGLAAQQSADPVALLTDEVRAARFVSADGAEQLIGSWPVSPTLAAA